MAVDINLYVNKGSDLKECVHLYFGKALQGAWDGWHWAEEQGMRVDTPNTLADKRATKGSVISRERLADWIQHGYLSPSPMGNDTSSEFLYKYPKSYVFRLQFLDWS